MKIKLWATKKDEDYARCTLCNCHLKYSSQGFQCLMQHSQKPKHKRISELRFGASSIHLASKPSTDSTKSQQCISIDPSLKDKVSAAEAMWLFKVAENDLSFRDCSSTPKLFQNMFPDSDICKRFTMSKDKASYVLQDGLSPLLSEWLCESVKKCQGCFTLIFDETSTIQNRKQMDLLLRYWDEERNQVVSAYLGSFFFCRAKAADVAEMLKLLHNDATYDLPWNRLFSISVDGPNINKAIYRHLNSFLKENNYDGLIELVTCTIHMVHNAFRKCVTSNAFGEMVDQLVFDLNAWFENSPCKSEDFRNLASSLTKKNEAIFIRHINTRWLTLSPALTVVLARWEDCEKYFLVYLPSRKDSKTVLTNQRYQRIKKCFTVHKNEMLLTIKFLLDLAPLFETYLTYFQKEDPCVHLLFPQMKHLVTGLLKRFVKPNVVDNNKLAKDLLKMDVTDTSLHLDPDRMDIGDKTTLSKMSTREKHILLNEMKASYVAASQHLLRKLPLDSPVLKDVTCLSPTARSRESSIEAIARLAALVPHVVSEREICLVRDEWRMYQIETIPTEWYKQSDSEEFGRLDHFWAKVLSIRTENGGRRYIHLAKVVKSFLSMANGNADVERSLSLNRNTLTDDRNRLSDGALIALRRAKEHATRCGGAHNVNTSSKTLVRAVQESHRKFEERKKREKEEIELMLKQEKEKSEAARKQLQMKENAKRTESKLERKEENLKREEAVLNEEHQISQRLLEDARKQIDASIEKNDMIGVKVAREMLAAAEKRLQDAALRQTEFAKTRDLISNKRKCAFEQLLQGAKIAKKQ